MKLYHSSFTNKDTLHPQFEVRGNNVFATIYNREAAGKTTLPWFEIKGNNIHTTTYNPNGHDARPMYEIRGDNVHTTIHNPNHSHMAMFNIKR